MKCNFPGFATLIACIVIQFTVSAQNVGINTTGASPDASAMLDISATNKGILIPRTDTTSVNAAGTPAKGLLIFQNSDTKFYFYTGSKWAPIAGSYTDSDGQTLTFNSSTGALNISGGNTVDLTALDTDDQTLVLNGNKLSISDGDTVDLASLNTDDQNLTLTGSKLSITNGDTVDLSMLNTDEQMLSISGKNITISNGNTITIPSSDTLSLIQDADRDTKVQTEKNTDEDLIRFTLGGTEYFVMIKGKLQVLNTGYSVFIGENAGTNDDGSNNNNIGIGLNALQNNTSGGGNVAIGSYTLRANTTASDNVAIGENTLSNLSSGAGNTVVGKGAFLGNSSGSNNTAVGLYSGYFNNGSSNVFIGHRAGQNYTGSDKLFIENSPSATPLIYGDFANDSLKVYGTLKIRDAYSLSNTDGTNGQVLTTNGAGVTSWQTPAADTDDQTLTMNNNIGELTITDGNTVEIKTIADSDEDTKIQTEESTDEDKIRFDVAGTEAMIISNTGNVGIGTSTPAEKLHVAGVISATNPGTSPNGSSMQFSSPANDIGLIMNRGNGSGGVSQRWDMKIATDNFLRFRQNNSTDIVTFSNAGDVGIGINTPQANLDVKGDGNGTADNSLLLRSGNNSTETISNQIMFSWDNGTDYKHTIKTRHQNTNDIGNAMDFYLWDFGTDASGTAGTKRVLTIDGNDKGMIGIGTSTPKSEVHISDGSSSSKVVTDGFGYGASMLITDNIIPRVYFEAAGQATDKKTMDISLSNQTLRVSSLNDAGTAYDKEGILSVQRDGRIGVNTISPAEALHIIGKFRMVDGNQGAGKIMVSDANGTGAWQNASTVFADDQTLTMNNTSGTLTIADGNSVLLSTIADTEADTKIQVEETADEDMIRFDLGGTEMYRFESKRIQVSSSNTLIGDLTGSSITSGYNNTGIGSGALKTLTTGYSNAAFGVNSLSKNTTGFRNTALGTGALESNLIGNNNTAAGYQALLSSTGDDNSAYGQEALIFSAGTGNVSIGKSTLYNNISGNYNTALGLYAGYFNNGSANVFLGHRAGQDESGSNKLYIENSNSLTPLIYGDFANDSVKIFGTFKIRNAYSFPNTDGTSGQVLTTNGTGLATWSNLSTIADADANTKIQVEESANENNIRFDVAGTEAMIINSSGNVGIGTTSNSFKLEVGTSGDGTEARANAWNTFSDRRWKKDFVVISSALDKIAQINGYYYKWKNKPDTTTQVGVIAQEIERVLPEVVATDKDGYKSVDYSKLTALLIQGMKEQQALIENQEQRLNNQEASIKDLNSKVELLFQTVKQAK